MRHGTTTRDVTNGRVRISKVLTTTIVVAATLPLLGFTFWETEQEIRDVLIAGTELHLGRQGTYSNGCGDSAGPPNVPEISNTWEWTIDSGSTCWNVAGISAAGVLAAYERVHLEEYLDAALLMGDTLVEKYQMITADGAQWEDRPYAHDIEFLVRLSRASRQWSYYWTAYNWHRVVTDNETAEEIADRYIDKRLSLAGWDLASHIRAALKVGKKRYALGIAERLLERRSDWEGVINAGYDYTLLSYTSLLWAFHEFGFGSPDIVSARREFRTLILEAQRSDGSWDNGSYQTTAYAVIGLDAVRSSRRNKDMRQALGNAFVYLRDAQTIDGGWSYPPEYGEVNSEVLMAIGELFGCEITLPTESPVSDAQSTIGGGEMRAHSTKKPSAQPMR